MAIGFPATRPSAVLAAQSADATERERGLAALAEAYWKPVYKYLRVRFRESNADAEDLTQGFFARALEKDFFDGYDSARGSFRTGCWRDLRGSDNSPACSPSWGRSDSSGTSSQLAWRCHQTRR